MEAKATSRPALTCRRTASRSFAPVSIFLYAIDATTLPPRHRREGSTLPLRPLRHPQDFGTPDFVECLRTTPCETPVMIAADSAKARRERIAAARVRSMARVKRQVPSGPGARVVAKHPAAAYLPRGQALAHIRAAAEAVAQKHAGRGGGWRPNS